MPAIRNVVFDLGGVLIDWDPRYLYRQLLPDEAAVEQFLGSVCTRAWHVQHDRGVRYADTVPQLVAQFPAQRELIEAYDQRWADMLAGDHDDAVAILRALKDRHTALYALTNWPADKFACAQERFPFLQWFDGIVVSGCVGVMKPDPRIFTHLLSTFHLQPAETLFLDDLAENAAAASRLGMHGFHYRSAPQLRQELLRLGLL